MDSPVEEQMSISDPKEVVEVTGRQSSGPSTELEYRVPKEEEEEEEDDYYIDVDDDINADAYDECDDGDCGKEGEEEDAEEEKEVEEDAEEEDEEEEDAEEEGEDNEEEDEVEEDAEEEDEEEEATDNKNGLQDVNDDKKKKKKNGKGNEERDIDEINVTIRPIKRDDQDMLSARHKQRARVDRAYARRHLQYTLHEYRDELYEYMRQREHQFKPSRDFIASQRELSCSMRSKGIGWMITVSKAHHISRETVHLAVSLMDRFLSIYEVKAEKLLLVEIAALLISSKYEEVDGMFATNFVYFFPAEVIKLTEVKMLRALEFRVGSPTAVFFCGDLLDRLAGAEEIHYAMSYYILDTTLVIWNKFTLNLPSKIACSAVLMSFVILERNNCMGDITPRTGYSLEDISDCARAMFLAIQSNDHSSKRPEVKDKYLKTKYNEVARLTIPEFLSFEDFLSCDF